jgi:GT2 family glycosyltransferase
MRDRLRRIELSAFWRARNRFFALKNALGFSSDAAWDTFELPPAYAAVLDSADPYARWRARNDPRASDLETMRAAARVLAAQPTFAIVIAGASAGAAYERTLTSLRAGVYPHWTLASGATSAADFVCFVDAGDELAPDALFRFAVAIAGDSQIDLLYSDEDSVDENARRFAPNFKPQWSPDTLRSRNYVGDFVAYRRTLVEAVGSLRPEYGSAARYDLLLRVSEVAKRIVHVPHVLYHRAVRTTDTATVARASDDAKRAIAAALERAAEHGTIVDSGAHAFVVRYTGYPSVRASILIPTRDHAEDLERCLGSLFERSTYADFEILLIDNGTRDAAALAVIERFRAADPRLRVLPMDVPFNYSRLNNAAARAATGEVLVLLNNDTEIVTPDWLEALLEQASRPAIGAVGAYLLYPDGFVQHAGVILGIGGVAGHSHRNEPSAQPGYFGALETITNYSAVTAACLAVRKSVFDEVGGLDETLTVAFNDVDFCLRIGRAGYRNVWLPHVVLRHGESRSRGHDVGFGKTRRSLAEQAVMLERWNDLISDDPYYSPHLTRLDESYAIRVEL